MKKILLTAFIAFATLTSTQMTAQQGFGTNNPDKSSAVDIVSTKRGLLIPRIDLTSTTVASPVANPAQSLLVYNKNTAGDVTPGFYYWESNKWVRVMSSNVAKTSGVIDGLTTNVTSAVSTTDPNHTEYKVEVDEAALKLESIGGSLNASQITEGANKQVLVTKEVTPGVFETVWVDASEVIGNGILVGDGLTKTGNEISLGGKIDSEVILDIENGGSIKIKDLASLPEDGTQAFNASSDKIMVMNSDGTLKQASVSSIINDAIVDGVVTGKNLTATDDSILVTDGTGATLKNVSVKVADGGITNIKLDANAVTTDKIADNAVETSDIKNGAVTTDKIANDAITADKIHGDIAGAGLQQNATTGALEVNLSAGGIGKALLTDDVIQITGAGATSTSSANESVLKDIKLGIGADAITAAHIATGAVTTSEIFDGTILAADMKSEGNSKVMVTDANGNVTWIDQTALGNTVTVNNGLTKEANNIQLGGTLVKATKITTEGTNTLAIEGLKQVAEDNSLVVVQKDGVLRTTTRVISASTASTLSVNTITGYSPYVQEVNVSVTAGASNFDINLPDATAANGQVINIKLVNTAEVDGYVSLKSGGTELTYGSLPYQGWILKSNGSTWSIVGRN